MPVRLAEINVRNLGPIDELSLELGQFNLIYGKNEKGKTYLVEFLLRSLFKSGNKWKLRGEKGDGKITVEGLADDPIVFSPSTRIKKLEDYLTEASPGMPTDLSKLLVVKGAELELVRDKPGGVNRSVLKEYLSSEAVLDQILIPISKTVQKASIDNGVFVGTSAGDIAKQQVALDQLRSCDALLEEVDRLDSGGLRAHLRRNIDELIENIKQMMLARRFSAFTLTNEIEELDKSKDGFTSTGLINYRELAIENKGARDRLDKYRIDLQGLIQASAQYTWLDKALREYKDVAGSLRRKPSRALLFLGGLFLFSAIVSMTLILLDVLSVPLGAGISSGSILVMGIFFLWHTIAQSRSERAVFEHEEILKITSEFERKFNEEIPSIAALEKLHRQLQKDFVRGEQLEEAVQADEAEVQQTETRLGSYLSKLDYSNENNLSGWSDKINFLEARLAEIDREIAQKREERAALGVEPSDYLADDPGVVFQQSVLKVLEETLISAQEDLDEADSSLESLRIKLSGFLGISDGTIELDDLLFALREKRHDLACDYRKKTAILIAMILLKDELEILRGQEDLKIQESLASEELLRPLQKITGHYTGIHLEDDQLQISDPFNTFPLEELSTGAQEQVLLALRIGVASRILHDDALFLVLDDAFQHADWDRRKALLMEVSDLAKAGWQIIYLTMDDHIQKIFDIHGEKTFGKDYRSLELSTS